MLARELNVPPSRLMPLIEQGYIRRVDGETVETPLPAAMLWLRGWFQPVQAKPLLSQADMAALLNVEERAIPALAAAHDAPVVFDPALGLTFSVWSARRLLMEVLGTGTRFDRQSLLWFLIGNPAKLAPPFNQALEDEIQRIAKLDEPARSIRRENLLNQWRDAVTVSGVTPPPEIERAFRKLA